MTDTTTISYTNPDGSIPIGYAAHDYTPRPGWDLTINDKYYHRDDIEAASDDVIHCLITEARKEHRSVLGEHVWVPTVLENILLKRKVERLEAKFAQLEETVSKNN
jgi:hypothetical protein